MERNGKEEKGTKKNFKKNKKERKGTELKGA